MNRLLLLSCLLLLTAGFDSVAAQEPLPVRMRLQPLSTRGRSGGAIPLRIKLEYNSPQILEGDLRLQMYNSTVSPEDLSAELRYEGIVLQGSDYIFNTVLPPVEHSYNKLFQIVAWFETEGGRIPLTSDPKQVDPPAPHDLLSLSRFERSTLICSVTGMSDARRPSATRAFLGNRLSLDNYNPPDRDVDKTQVEGVVSSQSPSGVQNFTATWSVVDFPEDPLQLCAFDVVLLADGALGLLEQRQMDALTHWVRAGGSLCVLPDSKRLRGPHLQFLQTLFQHPDDPTVSLTLSENELLVISDLTSPIINRFYGLGRVTLLPNLPQLETRLTDQHLRTINGHLWKVRRDNNMWSADSGWYRQVDVRNLLSANSYDVRRVNGGFQITSVSGRGINQFEVDSLEEAVQVLGLTFRLEPQANVLSSAAETALLPKGIRMVPTWVIAVLLVAYVIAIGPLDYLVLGFFKARKYTWVVFPVVTALFTWLTVSIAHSYLSSTDSGGRVTIIDLDDVGQPVRQSSLQMHFYAAQTQVEKEVSEQFVVPAQVTSMTDWQRYQNTAPMPVNATMSYTGRFPQNFTTVQNVRQWEPQTVRTLTLAPGDVDLPACDWNNAELVTTPDGRLQLAEQLRGLQTEGVRVDAVVLHQGDLLSLLNGFLFSTNVRNAGDRWMRQEYYQRQYDEPNHDAILSNGLLAAASSTSRTDFFSIVSQVSPHGAATLEDLPLLDASDPHAWLLMVVVEREGETAVFRKVFHTKRPGLMGVE